MSDVIQVIKYEGNNKSFIWKHPIEDFNTGTQLIVHESQRAIFFMNGQALDEFQSGRYTLETQNIPKIKKVFNNISEGNTTFHCEVYFINMTEQMGIKWGLKDRVNYLDPNYNNYPFQVGCRGEMSLVVIEPRKLLVKLVGTTHSLDQESLVDKFRAQLMMKINTYLPSLLQKKAAPIFTIGQYTEEFAREIHKNLLNDYEDYGITIPKFWIEEIVLPEDDPTYKKLKELTAGELTIAREEKLQQQRDIIRQDTEQRRKMLDAEAEAYRNKVRGITVQEELAYGVAKAAAENEASGGLANIGTGLGMMAPMAYGIGSAVAGIASNALEPIRTSFNTQQQGYAPQVPNNFQTEMPEMLSPMEEADGQNNIGRFNGLEERMNQLMLAKEKGFISDEEFEVKRKEIIAGI